MKNFIIIFSIFFTLISISCYMIWRDFTVQKDIVQKIEVTQNLNGKGQWKIETWLLSDGNCVYQFTDRKYPTTLYRSITNAGDTTYSISDRGYKWEPVHSLSWRN